MAEIHHIALRVSNCQAAARFYTEVFGFPEVRTVVDGDEVRAVWLQAGKTVLMLERGLRGFGASSGSGHVLIFPSNDLAAAEERLAMLGVRISDRTESTLYFEDPDGHRTGFSTFRFPEMAP